MGLRCFFGHKWKILLIRGYVDKSFGGYAPSNYGTYQCRVCGKLKPFENYFGGMIDAIDDDIQEEAEGRPNEP